VYYNNYKDSTWLDRFRTSRIVTECFYV